ncbi:PREDICTED: sodium-dependent proline transporter-like, partial [Galeopterus variegatus]|uniref:Sodium-dependent proline transporter-like n=1 Tax=Galeopterus variegatus TaxID=482537 RepID=A0ABM0Q4L1_GALVR
DTFIVTLGNAITSILAGFAIFSVLGYMSQELGVPVDQVAKAGPGLAFVVYPQAMTMLPLSPFWSFLFFFMLLTLGLDSQIFYSLGVGFGGLLTFASYNTFHQNIYRDTFIVTLGNAITSILAGFAIFSVLGYMSQELGVPVDQVAKAGPGLAFVVYPQAMTMLPLSPFWSFLFFFMLLTLGLDSQFAFLETIVTAVTDEFPYYLRPKKVVFSGLICVAMYLMGLILTTEGGMYWLVLLDDYSASFGLMVVVITTCLAVTRVYGIRRFCRDIHMMLGFKPGLYFRACWLFLSPATLLALLVYSIVKYQPSEYGSYRFPAWAELLGILMGLLSCLMIPAGMLVAVLQEEGSLWE